MTRLPVLAAALALALALPASAGTPPDGFVLSAGGDLIGPYHPLRGQDDATLARLKALWSKADAVVVNHEGSTFESVRFAGWPAAENGGGTPLMPPAAIADVRAAGAALMTKANNHATDWGTEGLVQSLAALKALGVVTAGAGASEAEARAPGYLDTRRGRVAVVDCASTFLPMSVAGAESTYRGVTRARPGISALHVKQVRLVTAEELAALRGIVGGRGTAGPDVRVGETTFRAADRKGSTWEMDAKDEAAILAAVREARTRADVVVFAIHAHEAGADDTQPADFLPKLFHAAIDAGADMVVRTGPHLLNGVELYKGRPIFYSLGSLFFDFGGQRSYRGIDFPDSWYETIVPVVTFRAGRPAEVRLRPFRLDGSAGPVGGAPVEPPPGQAQGILERVRAMSAPFGTTVRIEGGEALVTAGGG